MKLDRESNMELSIIVLKDATALACDAALAHAVDDLGERSAVAQHLNRPITSTQLFAQHAAMQSQLLYVALYREQVIGLLKTGRKHLFYVDSKGVYTEIDPVCLLDFYVRDEFQRHGVGLQLFTRMLQNEHVDAHHIAYDRPSPKLITFLSKHANLTQFTPQPNNYVVFNDYFTNLQQTPAPHKATTHRS